MNYLVRFVIILLMKSVPWSLVKLLGQPNLVVLFSMINIIAVSDEQSVVRVASAHRVR
uniref:Uncharacterized protein n=1 Tax=Picea glauca TaxID=3330 RepID=A0A101M180_PICGL|nr:hypothetical protein ABT39_MTgene4396 [Picea glauca]